MKLLTEQEKKELVYFPACLLNATIAIACNEIRKAVNKVG
jgi:hypothetical protein